MIDLILASLFFPLSHFLISSTSLRALLVNLIGERRYSLGYSLLAIAALVWLIFAYHHAPVRPLWGAPWWLGLALSPVILVSGILAVAGITPPNPVIVRSEALFDRTDIVQGILFGSIGLLGIAGASILDDKKARKHGMAWHAFAEVTSNIPFLAIIQGRQRFVLREIGLWRIALGVCVSLGALALHGVGV